ncbi:hypothetical protein EJ06DRAFT_407226 [Trichodelitschia bisporula]|uniref:Uncharacterized protein n=1 Tax=Trichodelitschia bisporula TaxID=703511 RepID=A0A6G1HXX9_9PEZI|nr:hypothetical protein EJ06DRAFT_407226 [Trichodelitschia bisporula]
MMKKKASRRGGNKAKQQDSKLLFPRASPYPPPLCSGNFLIIIIIFTTFTIPSDPSSLINNSLTSSTSSLLCTLHSPVPTQRVPHANPLNLALRMKRPQSSANHSQPSLLRGTSARLVHSPYCIIFRPVKPPPSPRITQIFQADQTPDPHHRHHACSSVSAPFLITLNPTAPFPAQLLSNTIRTRARLYAVTHARTAHAHKLKPASWRHPLPRYGRRAAPSRGLLM